MLEQFPAETPTIPSPKLPPRSLEAFVSEDDLSPSSVPVASFVPVASSEAVAPSVAVEPSRSTRIDRRLVAAAVLGSMLGAIAAIPFATLTSTPVKSESQAVAPASPQPQSPQQPEVAATQLEGVRVVPQRSAPQPVALASSTRRESPPRRAETGSISLAEPIAAAATPDPVIMPAPLIPEPLANAPAAVVPAEPPAAAPTIASAAPPSNPPQADVTQPVENNPSPPAVSANERSAIENLLTRYRSAYEGLDARAVKQIWPTVTEPALAKAFGALESQSLGFSECDTTVDGPIARARCDGQVSYVGRVGPRQPRTQKREWTFTLRKTAGAWEIERVQVR